MKTVIIIKEFFDTIRKLLKYELNDQICEIYDKVLYSILETFKCQNKFEECATIIEKTNCLKTVGDGLMLGVNINLCDQDRLYLQIKSEMINEEKIEKTKIFSKELFIDELTKDALAGNINSNKLLAVLYLEGLLVNPNLDKAIYFYQILAYANDKYSMQCLARLYNKNKQFELEQDWNKVIDIIDIYNDSYLMNINDTCYDILTLNSITILKKIYALRNRFILRQKLELEISMINYAIQSNRNLLEILGNISNLHIDGYQLLLKEQNIQNKKYNF